MKTKKMLLIGGGVVVVAAIVVTIVIVILRLSTPPPTTAPGVGGRGVVAMPENIEELREKAKQPVEDGYFETRMNVEWKFPSSSSESTNAYVENSTNNKRTVYFDLVLADTNELIYSSPFIPVGARIEKFKLDTAIPAGEYSGVVTYHLVDDDHQELTTVSVGVTLQIEN